jgi:hypothetical protein
MTLKRRTLTGALLAAVLLSGCVEPKFEFLRFDCLSECAVKVCLAPRGTLNQQTVLFPLFGFLFISGQCAAGFEMPLKSSPRNQR